MSLLIPLGLLGLLSLIVLLIIYIIKPNYQNKFTSTNFIWNLSLRMKKKKLPTSKLRNILLIICQVLILVLTALILAKPVQMFLAPVERTEAIGILDSSASMLTELDGSTRYERAVSLMRSQANTMIDNNGEYSIIVADRNPSFLVTRANSVTKANMVEAIDDLVDPETGIKCSYSTSDIDKAISLCEEILVDNTSAQIYLYTDKTYAYVPKGVNVVNVLDVNEYNIAILDAYAEFNDGYYDIVVDLVSYGKDSSIDLDVKIKGANVSDTNPDGEEIVFQAKNYKINCSGDEVTRVIYKGSTSKKQNEDQITYFDIEQDKFTSFDSISLMIDADDNYYYDNTYEIFGGKKEKISFQYITTEDNQYVTGALASLRNIYSSKYDITFSYKINKAYDEGYDYYIFEHTVPQTMPKDGIVIFIDPQGTPDGGGFKYAGDVQFSKSEFLTVAPDYTDHRLVKHTDFDLTTVTRINKLTSLDEDYQVLAEINGYPTILFKDAGASKVFIIGFSTVYSNASIVKFPIIFSNALSYFTPKIIPENTYEIYDEVSINNRGTAISIYKDNKLAASLTENPSKYQFNTPGIYEVAELSVYDKELNETVFVKLPTAESNIFEHVDTMEAPYHKEDLVDQYNDLIFYFALALTLLVFAEWWLKGRENR